MTMAGSAMIRLERSNDLEEKSPFEAIALKGLFTGMKRTFADMQTSLMHLKNDDRS